MFFLDALLLNFVIYLGLFVFNYNFRFFRGRLAGRVFQILDLLELRGNVLSLMDSRVYSPVFPVKFLGSKLIVYFIFGFYKSFVLRFILLDFQVVVGHIGFARNYLFWSLC